MKEKKQTRNDRTNMVWYYIIKNDHTKLTTLPSNHQIIIFRVEEWTDERAEKHHNLEWLYNHNYVFQPAGLYTEL